MCWSEMTAGHSCTGGTGGADSEISEATRVPRGFTEEGRAIDPQFW